MEPNKNENTEIIPGYAKYGVIVLNQRFEHYKIEYSTLPDGIFYRKCLITPSEIISVKDAGEYRVCYLKGADPVLVAETIDEIAVLINKSKDNKIYL